MNEYAEHTAPAIELFREAGVLIEIDGERAPEEIAKDVNAALNIQ